MSTSKPIGTISYNTPNFIMHTLQYLINTSKIDDYRLIQHYPEEENKKQHFHLLVYPARRLDPVYLANWFSEPDPLNPDKPLGVRPFRNSEPLNWLLYVLHDEDYLSTHGRDTAGDGKIPYTLFDVVAHCREYLEQDFLRCQAIRTSPNQRALRLALNGYTFPEIMAEVPSINPSALLAILRGVQSVPK